MADIRDIKHESTDFRSLRNTQMHTTGKALSRDVSLTALFLHFALPITISDCALSENNLYEVSLTYQFSELLEVHRTNS
jgi:hypothetical protein